MYLSFFNFYGVKQHSVLTGHSVIVVASQANWSHHSCFLQLTTQWKKPVASEMAQFEDDTVVDQLTWATSPSCTGVERKYMEGIVFITGSFH